MNPILISAIASAAIMAAGTIWYVYLIVTDKVAPLLPAWIVSGTTLSLSFATYWTSPRHSLIGNIANSTAALGAGLILAILGVRYWIKGEKIVFSPFQVICLKSSLAIAILWIVIVWGFGKSGLIPNLMTQALMIVSYVIYFQKTWNADKNTESYILWGSIVLSTLFGLYGAIERDEGLSILYAVRSGACASTLIWLMHRADRKYRLATT